MKRRSRSSGQDRPLIGVTTAEIRRAQSIEPIPRSDPPRHELALGLTYLLGLEAAGGLPVVLPSLGDDAIEPLLDQFDGIVLPGGPDIDPSAYGAEPHPQLGPTEPDLDRFELALTRHAHAREMPLLAICRGMQALNVALGGTLHQHLPDVSTEVEHRQGTSGAVPSHPISIEGGSLLEEIVGSSELQVNSFHHQAVDRLAEGLEVTARAPDGIVEAVEDPRRRFLIGVQWHAETLVHRPHESGLFRSFVEACRGGGGA
jgi:putative glutamine amidotransferase